MAFDKFAKYLDNNGESDKADALRRIIEEFGDLDIREATDILETVKDFPVKVYLLDEKHVSIRGYILPMPGRFVKFINILGQHSISNPISKNKLRLETETSENAVNVSLRNLGKLLEEFGFYDLIGFDEEKGYYLNPNYEFDRSKFMLIHGGERSYMHLKLAMKQSLDQKPIIIQIINDGLISVNGVNINIKEVKVSIIKTLFNIDDPEIPIETLCGEGEYSGEYIANQIWSLNTLLEGQGYPPIILKKRSEEIYYLNPQYKKRKNK